MLEITRKYHTQPTNQKEKSTMTRINTTCIPLFTLTLAAVTGAIGAVRAEDPAPVTKAVRANKPVIGVSPTGIKNVVLVHGAFADGSGWEPVANILTNAGYTVSVVQHPETSYAEDQKYTKAAIDAMDGPVVLVGHSYGGSVITEAGNHPKVAALVYIAAFALDEGES